MKQDFSPVFRITVLTSGE